MIGVTAWESLSPRVRDTLVSQAMGQNVLGETWCYRGSAGWGWQIQGDYHSMHAEQQPVYLHECVCAAKKEFYEFREFHWRAKEEKVLGHYPICLRVVREWTTDSSLWEDMKDALTPEEERQFVIALSEDVLRVKSLIYYEGRPSLEFLPGEAWDFLNATQDQKCWAFVKVKGLLL